MRCGKLDNGHNIRIHAGSRFIPFRQFLRPRTARVLRSSTTCGRARATAAVSQRFVGGRAGARSELTRCRREGSVIRREYAGRRRRTAGSGLRRPPVRRILTSTRGRPRASSRRGDRSERTSSRHRIQRIGSHAVRPRRRRQGRGWSYASRGADRRGHARAGHPHNARARGRRDRRAGIPRTGPARRSADTGGGQPHSRGDLRVLCLTRRRGTRAEAGRVHDRAPRSRARDYAAAFPGTVTERG
jgi:hypothetical protein